MTPRRAVLCLTALLNLLLLHTHTLTLRGEQLPTRIYTADLLDLTRRTRRHADELFTLGDIKLNFTAPGPSQNLRMGVDVRRDLFLIFKEAVNNAVRHARCTEVDIELQIDGPWLRLRVTDDGVGFEQAEEDGQGLASMKRRAKTLGGTLTIGPGPGGRGASVQLKMPMPR